MADTLNPAVLAALPGKLSCRAPVPFSGHPIRRNEVGTVRHPSPPLGLLGTQFLDSPQ
jgi:hypothetical protein